VNVKLVLHARVTSRNDNWFSIYGEADMTDESLVQYFINAVSIVYAALSETL
jgi:hypothetical protein